MDEKKKLIVLGVLAALLIAVGVFAFMPKGEPPVTEVKTDPNVTGAQLQQTPAADAPKNPQMVAGLNQRDPFMVPLTPIAPLKTGAGTSPVNFVHPTTMKELRGSLLPGANADGTTTGSTGPVAPAIPPFGYTVTGVVVGRRPAVVFRDPQGNQKLIAQGGQLDGDTRVESVNLRYVVVNYHGNSMKLNVGEEQSRLGGMVAK